MQFTIKLSQLKGMIELASKNDIRYYLNGVRIEFNYDKTRLIACDGHKLGVLNIDHTYAKNEGVGALTIPRSFIDKLPKTSKRYDPYVTISQSVENATFWHCEYDNVKTSFSEIEGKYPDYARVFSGIKTSGKPGHFNNEYINQFKKCGLILTNLSKDHFFPDIFHNDNSSALVELPTLKGQFLGVLMPLKSDHVEGVIPDSSIYAPLIQNVTVQNNAFITESEKLAA